MKRSEIGTKECPRRQSTTRPWDDQHVCLKRACSGEIVAIGVRDIDSEERRGEVEDEQHGWIVASALSEFKPTSTIQASVIEDVDVVGHARGERKLMAM